MPSFGASGGAVISVPLDSRQQGLLGLYDVMGRQVQQASLSGTGSVVTIDGTRLPAGTYFLHNSAGNVIARIQILN